MLRKYEPSAKTYDNYLQDSDLTPITTSHSIFNNLMQSVGTNVMMAQEVASVFTGVPMVDDGLRATQEMFERENNSPQQGVGQITANTLANMIGSGLGTGFLGKLAGRGVGLAFGQLGKKALPVAFENFSKKPLNRIFGEDVRQYLPKIAQEEGERTLTTGEFGLNLTSSYGAGAGFVLPQAVTENYNADQNTLHWGGIAKESLGYGGSMGLAVDVFPYTAGVIWGKTKGFLGEAEKMPMPGTLKGVLPENFNGEESGAQHHPTLDKLWTAHQQGRISLGEYKWMRDYLVNPTNLEDMRQRGVSILMKDGHPVDAGQLNVLLQLMKPEDAQSFLTAVSDQLGSAVDKQADTAMSDYIVNNGLDRLQSDPKLIDGLQGFYQFMSDKLSKKPEHLGRVERMREAPQEHINNTHPFSQKMIYTAAKNGAEQVPHTVPKNVARRLKQEQRVKELEERRKKYIGESLPQELADAKSSAEKEFIRADKDLTKAQGKLDKAIDKLAKHEEKISGLSQEPDFYHVAPSTFKEGDDILSMFEQRGSKAIDEFHAKWKYDLFEGDMPLTEKQQSVLQSHPKKVWLFKTRAEAEDWVAGRKENFGEDNKIIGVFNKDGKLDVKPDKTFGYDEPSSYFTVDKKIASKFAKSLEHLAKELNEAINKRLEFAAENKRLAQAVKFADTARTKAIKQMKHIETKMREHAKPGNVERIKRIEEKLEKLRNELAPILHPDDELREIEKSLIKDDGIPKNFRSTEAYQRLHDLAQISPRAKMLLHHVELLREYEKQEGYKNIADMLIQLSNKGFRKLADGDRVVSYLKDRVEQASGLKEAVQEKAERIKEEQVPQDAEKVLEEQGREQKTESEIHKEAYDEAKSKFDEFKKSENIFKNFIQCVMGSTNG